MLPVFLSQLIQNKENTHLMSDFIANSGDSELLAEAVQFHSAVSGSPSEFGLTPAQVTGLQTAINNLQVEYEQHVAARSAARSKTQSKNEKRDVLEKLLRELLRLVKAQSSVKESDLSALGQIVNSSYTPLSNPTRPTGKVDTSQRLRHTISFADEATPDSKRKPAGTIGCAIYQKTGGAPPTDGKECAFVALDTATPYVKEFEGEDAGKMIHYMLRWQLKDNSYSPWSETISATVAG